MKIKIVSSGIYGQGGKPAPVGTVLTVKAEPTHWTGKYEVVADSPSESAEPVLNDTHEDESADDQNTKALLEAARGDGRQKATRDAREKLDSMGIEW